jgi:hypothetical protein
MKTTYMTLILVAALTACAAPEVPRPIEPRAVELPPVPAIEPAPGAPAFEPPPPVPPPARVLAQVAGLPGEGGKANFLFSHARGGRTLIIQSSDPDPKTYANLEEDLSVMYRILSKTRKQDETGFRLESVLGGSSSSVKSMYIEGYGAVFMLGVRFPLVAPQASQEEPKPKDATSEEWERAKKEIYARNNFEVDMDQVWRKMGPATEEYDAQKVEELTAGILEGLKNATHIRNLKSDEYVTVAVLGAEAGQVRATVEKEDRDDDGKGKRKTRVESVSSSGRGESTMTIRAKKSEIDDFAKGKLNLEGFRKKVKTLVYLRPVDGTANPSVLVAPRRP